MRLTNNEYYGSLPISFSHYSRVKGNVTFTSDTLLVINPRTFSNKRVDRSLLRQRGYDTISFGLRYGQFKVPPVSSPLNDRDWET